MKLTLNLMQDEELRKVIKEAVRSQVKSVAREEITSILKSVLGEKLKEEVEAIISDFKRNRMEQIVLEAFDSDRGDYQIFSRGRAFESIKKIIAEAGSNIMKELIQSKYPAIEADIRESLKKAMIERFVK